MCVLRTWKTCKSTVGFSKYEFNNKLLGSVTLLKVTPGVTWTNQIIIIGKNFKLIGTLMKIIFMK